jgi:small-conductance mechanosensitive channel
MTATTSSIRRFVTETSPVRPATLGCTRCRFGLVFALLFAIGAAATAQERPGPFEPASVVVWNREITVFRMPYGSSSPADRALRARRTIESLPLDRIGNDIELQPATVTGLEGLLVSVGGVVLFGIAEDDLDPLSGETLASAGERARQRLRGVFDARIEQRRVATLLRGFGTAVVAVLVLAVVFYGDSRLRRRVERRFERREQAVSRRIGGFDVRPLLTTTRRSVVALVVWTWRLMLSYVALTVVLAQFPYTRPWADRLGQLLFDLARHLAGNVVAALPDLLVAIVIFVIALMVTRAIDALLKGAEGGQFEVSWLHPTTVPATRRIIKLVIWLFAISFAYPFLPGAESRAFQTLSVLTGAALSLGATGIVGQLISGLVLIYSQALKKGDLVQIGDTVGFVVEIGILSTKLRTTRGELVTLPNTVVLTQRVTNYFAEGALLATTVTIGYEAPWRQVHALLLGAAERTAGLLREPKPYVVQRGLSQFYIEYELRAGLERPADRYPVLTALHTQILDAFNEAGVQIMTPQYEEQPRQRLVVPRDAWHGRPADTGEAARDNQETEVRE